MAVGEVDMGPVHPVDGIRLGTASAGIKCAGQSDVTLIELGAGSTCVAVFTTNRFRAAPVRVAETHLADGSEVRYLLVNTGNANAGTGRSGIDAARECCEAVASLAQCEATAVLPYSTGVIGEPLPTDRIVAAVPAAYGDLSPDGWHAASEAILTTDTRPKTVSERITIAGRSVTLTGVAKGAGMIRPDMATMLAFVATDVALEPALARRALRDATGVSFNRITVDGDTSTNDACTLMATGRSGVTLRDRLAEDYDVFLDALTSVCTRLAQAIVRDAEGATRFVTVRVTGAAGLHEAERVGFVVAESPLVKTAIFAGDPNWGRILAAVGRAGIDDLNVERVRLWLGDYPIAENGGRAADYEEAEASERMSRDEVVIEVDLGRGTDAVDVWTSDLSYEYVRINADYRT